MSGRLVKSGAILAVAAAGVLGGLIALWSYSVDRTLSVGTVSVAVSPFHAGALDVYVPVVDWGLRFGGVRFPARVRVEVRTVDRGGALELARGGIRQAARIRADARDGIASYLRALAPLAAMSALALSLLVAAALRRAPVRPRWLLAMAMATSVGWGAAVALLLAPRGDLSDPVYYAHGSDIPIALRVLEAASQTPGNLAEQVDSQLVGLARLVTAPGNRVPLRGLPRFVLASDLHNNAVVVPALRRAAAGAPLIVAGDLSDRGTPLETDLLSGIVKAGHPVVVVAGNHDSDRSMTTLAQRGAIVLTRRGRLLPDGTRGPVVVRVGDVRLAGYESPNVRVARQGYRDRGSSITEHEQALFRAWLAPLLGQVDMVIVHEPELAAPAVEDLRRLASPTPPLVVLEGHTHQQAVRAADGVIEINAGTAGGGGTGNLDERQPIGLAIVTYAAPFLPLAVDLVELAPGTGGGSARRIRFDSGPVEEGDVLAPSPEADDG